MAHLENQVVLITGCSSGIGRALAEAFAASGHRVVATARKIEAIEDLASTDTNILELDVTDGASIERAVAAAIDMHGAIDVAVNNAGYGLIGPVAELDLAELRNQFETNVVGVVAVVRAVVPGMVARKTGRIVNIGSVSGVTATPFGGAYCGTKAAVHLISDALRMELAPFGIRVITVQPGAVESRFAEHALHGIERYREDSLYSSVFDGVQARAGVSQVGSTPSPDFARLVVDSATAASPPSVLRAGKHSVGLPLIGRLPACVRDRILSKRFGLETL
ncbi:MAG: SDR family NAD(P)-dependent oxidoreductase [Acidobacteria bacterium]|nr:SDR family NAD(P)-dependent oxidoreductase [Acidobacteriota bacterium]